MLPTARQLLNDNFSAQGWFSPTPADAPLCDWLVESGIVTAEGVDDTLRHGLARRWVLLGALETINLNAPGGVADYLDRYGPTMARLSDGAARGEAFTPGVAAKLAATLPAPARVAELSAKRDRDLTALSHFLKTLS